MPCAAIANRTVSSLARKRPSIRPTAVDPAGPRSSTWFAATAVVDGVAVAVGGVPALVSGSSVPRVKTNASTTATIASAAPMSSAPPRREEDSRVGATSPRSGATADSSAASSSSNHESLSAAASPGGVAGAAFPFTRGCSGPVGSAGTASPPGISRSAAATCAAQRCASGSASSSPRVRSACACDCWPRSQSAISPDRAGVGRSGASAARPPRARVRIVFRASRAGRTARRRTVPGADDQLATAAR